MRRPAVVIPVFFGAGIFLAYQLDQGLGFWLILATFTGAVCIWLLIRKVTEKIVSVWICIGFFFAGGCLLLMSDAGLTASSSIDTEQVCVEGIVLDVKQKDDYRLVILKNRSEKTLLKAYGQMEIAEGVWIRAIGEKELPAGRRNPGCFDYGLYLKSCGVGCVIKTNRIETDTEKGIPVLMMSAKIKASFKERLISTVPEETAGLIMGIMFGEKEGMDQEIYEEFQGNGTAHILAVSGLHVGILYGFFVSLWKWRKGALFYILTMAALLFYVVLADFSPSVIRASIMIVIHTASGILNRRYDIMSAAGTTFFIMVLQEPFRLFNTGVQMSFLAVFSVGMIMPYIKSLYSGVFLASAAIQLGLMPYTAFTFNYIAAGAVLINVPVIFAGSLLLPAGLLLLVLMGVPGDIFEIVAGITAAGCDILIWLNHVFYSEGLLTFDTVSPPVWSMILYYGLLVFTVSEAGQLMRIRKLKTVMFRMTVLLIFAAVCTNVIVDDGFKKAEIVFVDVGQGNCIHIRTEEGNFLIDGGGSRSYDVGESVLRPYLLKNGVHEIDAAYMTHLHEDHFGGIKSLVNSGMIKMIGMYDGNRVCDIRLGTEMRPEITYLNAGQKIELGKEVYLEIMSPEKLSDNQYYKVMSDEENENAISMIMKLDYEGCSILFTGDIDSEGELELIEKLGRELDCDIVTVPHHGSKYSSSDEFIKTLSPELAVFQVGRNNYGHPSEEVIGRYKGFGCMIFRNDMEGAVGLDIKKDGSINVLTMID